MSNRSAPRRWVKLPWTRRVAEARYASLTVEMRMGTLAEEPTSCSARIDGAAAETQSSDGSPERFSNGRMAIRVTAGRGVREQAAMVRAATVANRTREQIRGLFAPST